MNDEATPKINNSPMVRGYDNCGGREAYTPLTAEVADTDVDKSQPPATVFDLPPNVSIPGGSPPFPTPQLPTAQHVQKTHDSVFEYRKEWATPAQSVELVKIQHLREIRNALGGIREALEKIAANPPRNQGTEIDGGEW